MKKKILWVLLFAVILIVVIFFYFQNSSYNITNTGYNILGGLTGYVVASTCEGIEDVGNLQCHPTRENRYQECREVAKLFGGVKYVWTTLSCGADKICEGEGQCVCTLDNACETEGKVTCLDSSHYTICEQKPSGCLKESVSKRVSTGMICYGEGELICDVKESCEVEGQKECSYYTDRYRLCEADSNGCLKWVNSVSCPSGQVCYNDECVEGKNQDSNACELGDKICLANDVYECERSIWGYNRYYVAEDCKTGTFCLDGECVVGNCYNGRLDEGEEDIDCGGVCEECGGVILSPPVCGDNIIDEGEECDDGNITNGDGCDSSCQIEIQIFECSDREDNDRDGLVDYGFDPGCLNAEDNDESDEIIPGNETLPGNETEFQLRINQYLMEVGQSVSITINKGDDVSVTYEEIRNDKILVTIERVPTTLSSIELETHSVTVDKIYNGDITVTVI